MEPTGNKRRSSILKVRHQVDVFHEETEEVVTGIERRVSFHNVKHVKQYDKEGGKFLHSSPLREKLTETMDSDVVVTPRGTHINNQTLDNTMAIFEKDAANQTRNTVLDMSIDGDENRMNETRRTEIDMSMDDVTRCTVIDMSVDRRFDETKRTVVDMSMDQSADDTMKIFNMTKQSLIIEKCHVESRSVEVKANETMNNTAAIFNITNSQNVSMDIEQTLQTKVPEEQDTMSVFNMTNSHNISMDLDTSPSRQKICIFPPTPIQEVPENDQTVSMDIETTAEVFKEPTLTERSVHMDISDVDAGDEEKLENDMMEVNATSTVSKVQEASAVVEEKDGGDEMEIEGTLNTSANETGSFKARMPAFDPAISNIGWMYELDSSAPEVLEMQEVIKEELEKLDTEKIEQNWNEETEKAWKRIQAGSSSKMKSDEKELVYMSRKMAELRFLDLRLMFAEKYAEQYKKERERVERETSKLEKAIELEKRYDEMKQFVEKHKSIEPFIEPMELKRRIKIAEIKQMDRLVQVLTEKTRYVKEICEKITQGQVCYNSAIEEKRILEQECAKRKNDLRELISQIERQ
ncbi:unnamed protein product [Caenorhabditis bovis]|uniref:Uncharacterized protein n=1 Tax=Caenorhabditis bovis TaxID=2654633 RepID=A0A8S1F5X5_9PELO|nr:unnamed protein product [Caenorhabditis bovis]